MIVYNSSKSGFVDDMLTNDIENIILKAFKKNLKKSVAPNEIRSWRNSMEYMNKILIDPEIPGDCGVSIEFQIPQTSNRIDFIITGQDEHKNDHAIIVELKGWSEAQLTSKDAVVKTVLNRSLQETSHPSYQAWSYAALLQGFNQTVYEENINLVPCAYLYNYDVDDNIGNDFYKEYIKKAPLFLKPDALRLREFVKKHVKYGDATGVMYRIDSGKIKPSKALADSVESMLKGNEEFLMIDEQKVVFETAMALAQQSSVDNKNVLIVEGGPGTGKSVVAVNLLAKITKKGLLTQYVSKNAAPRAVYLSKLTKSTKKSVISNLFKGSGSYVDETPNTFDVLIIDEAHRLNEKSGMYRNLGFNQVREIIRASKCAVFFLDEDQKVTLYDIGDKEEILRWAHKEGAMVQQMELTSQFRCNGSDGYLAWLDDVLQIRETANKDLNLNEYDFKIFSSPSELRDAIYEKNKINNKARIVAGYCWDWISRNNKDLYDITFPEYGFAAQWNLDTDGSLWIVNPTTVKEIGCIHTCQGLEVDYIGVIIGPDLIARDGQVLVDPSKRSKHDQSIKGYKKLLEGNAEEAKERIRNIIKNTYRTLMSRGMKGCYVYFTDKETEKLFRSRIE